MKYETVIGLEVHAQLMTQTKIFCGCPTTFGNRPNTLTCPVCLGMPGVLPVANIEVVAFALKTAIATHCAIQMYNQFARKNYFYPDLPKGYQISQFELPIATGGYIDIELENRQKRIGITRIHMEEDAGKLMHELEHAPSDSSYVDFNRTGVPLMEIVSEPDMSTPAEAGEYLKVLRTILQYLDVCDGNMEQGSFRCDANISLRPVGSDAFGTKVELKNMNSFRHVVKALEYETVRQTELLDDGEKIIQETRLWNEAEGVTFAMRSKEEAHDYRYFPDPDLVPLVINNDWLDDIKGQMPELPQQKVERFMRDYTIPLYDAKILTSSRPLSEYFEECVRIINSPKTISNWIMSDVLRYVDDSRDIFHFPVTPQHLGEMIKLIENTTISGKIGKTVFEEMRLTGSMPDSIVQEKGLLQLSNTDELDKVVVKIIDKYPAMVDEYRNGKEKVFGFLMGQIMKETKGKGNPKLLNELLRKKLGN